MGPQEKRLTRELAVYLVRSCSLALRDLPPGTALDPEVRRQWFERAYQEWQLTPRVDLVGRSPYEVIAAERAAAAQQLDAIPTPTLELYTDLPDSSLNSPRNNNKVSDLPDTDTATPGILDNAGRDQHQPTSGMSRGSGAGDREAGWQRLANRLFGSWLDDDLERL